MLIGKRINKCFNFVIEYESATKTIKKRNEIKQDKKQNFHVQPVGLLLLIRSLIVGSIEVEIWSVILHTKKQNKNEFCFKNIYELLFTFSFFLLTYKISFYLIVILISLQTLLEPEGVLIK
jgi:hypothetical protein